MVKPKNKKSKNSLRELKVPVWFVDGFVGILALVIYNFILYFLTAMKVGGIIAQIDGAMGYFGLNTFTDLGMSSSSMTFGLIIVFIVAFVIGILIGNRVRKKDTSKK